MRNTFFPSLFVFFLMSSVVLAQEEPETGDTTVTGITKVVEKLKYKQQPGLALAASKIFFSDKRYSISGFGELNHVSYLGDKNTQSQDLELYYTQLFRIATFFGYRFTDKLIWNSELQFEVLYDRESGDNFVEPVIEAFVDYLWKDFMKVRFGFYPIPIGYVNSNDEPVMFYSVNRAEVERIVTPTTWIELGAMMYGNITEDLSYALGFSQGLNAVSYLGATWIRQGREIRFDVPTALSINPQLIYRGIENWEFSASGYYGNSGQGRTILEDDGSLTEVYAPINLNTGYVKYQKDRLRVVGLGVYGRLGETDKIYDLTDQQGDNGAQVLGRETFGALVEVGYDLWPFFKPGARKKEQSNWFYQSQDVKLPFFIRYERLNSHLGIHPSLSNANIFTRNQSDLDIVTLGFNFNTRENIVFKVNYQFRTNRYTGPNAFQEADFFEAGIGFIF